MIEIALSMWGVWTAAGSGAPYSRHR